jgi:aminoglycoside phosphotransferase (APT) family kinase protein
MMGSDIVQSLNKSKLSDIQMKSIINQAFGQSIQSIEELSDGWANVAYVIDLQDGRKVVLKVAPSKDKLLMRCEKNNMNTEVEALRMVSQMGGVPIPHIYTYDPSCSLVPSEYFIMEYIVGTPLNKIKESLSTEEKGNIEEQLGEYNRRINSIKGSNFGYFHDSEGLKYSWTEVFRRLLNDVLADGQDAGVELPVSYADIEIEIEKRITALDEVTEPCLVHWDLWDGNIFIHEGKISGIVDFERAIWGEPLFEYYFGKFGDSSSFEEGYGRGIVTDAERDRRTLYDLYLDLIMVIECDFRKYEDQDHIKWATRNFEEGFKKLQKV